MKTRVLVIVVAALVSSGAQSPKRQQAGGGIRLTVLGLYSPERVPVFRDAVARLPGVRVLDLDPDTAQATVAVAPTGELRNAPPREVAERLNVAMRKATHAQFGFRLPPQVPSDRLRRVEIRVQGIHCEACNLGIYESFMRVPGVAHATASLRDGVVTALIDPSKTDRKKLVELLQKLSLDVLDP